MFVDEKDAGYVALTPIYLLVSVSAPLWLYPYSYDYYDNDKFNLLPLLSGILTIGVGDTAASVFGTLFGKHQWPGKLKLLQQVLIFFPFPKKKKRFLYYHKYFGLVDYLSSILHITLFLRIKIN